MPTWPLAGGLVLDLVVGVDEQRHRTRWACTVERTDRQGQGQAHLVTQDNIDRTRLVNAYHTLVILYHFHEYTFCRGNHLASAATPK